MSKESAEAAGRQATEFLRAELEEWGDSFWRNEEMGERRVSFYLAFVTAVLGALVTLVTSKNQLDSEVLRVIAGTAILALSILGLVTLFRMVK